MKYIKYLEKIKNKNIKIGRIYRIGHWYDANHRGFLPIAKIIDMKDENSITLKTYFQDNNEEYIFNKWPKRNLLNIASPSEIDQFNTIENMKKYNL